MKHGNRPIVLIRKRKHKKHEGGHGSWKIAYADFMTAMMAFFMVMWLLSTASPEQRQGIAEYFKMPLKVALSQGDKSSLSDSVIPGGGDDPMKQEGEELRAKLDKIDHQVQRDVLHKSLEKLQILMQQDPRLTPYISNLRLALNRDGLQIQIIDSQDRPMFKLGSAEVEPWMRGILQAIVPVLNEIPNQISVTGHTDSLPYSGGEAGYSNWELSSDRANASRRVLVSAGLASQKFLRVIGSANMLGLTDSKADDPMNRRISLLVLSTTKTREIQAEEVAESTIPPEPHVAASLRAISETITPQTSPATE